LARQLGEKLKINVYHLDALFWKPNWVGVPKDEQIKVQNDLVKKESWIIDGNYGGTTFPRYSLGRLFNHIKKNLPQDIWRVIWYA